MERQVWKCEGDLTPELTMMIMKVMLGQVRLDQVGVGCNDKLTLYEGTGKMSLGKIGQKFANLFF